MTLTVTDDQGATDSVTKTVTPTGTAPFADDAFNRTVANGWGNADVGGPWTATGKAAGFSVSSGTALLKPTIGGTLTPVLGSTSSDDTDLTTTFSSDQGATGGGLYLFVTGRRVSVGNEYRARLRLTPTNTLALTYQQARRRHRDIHQHAARAARTDRVAGQEVRGADAGDGHEPDDGSRPGVGRRLC